MGSLRNRFRGADLCAGFSGTLFGDIHKRLEAAGAGQREKSRCITAATEITAYTAGTCGPGWAAAMSQIEAKGQAFVPLYQLSMDTSYHRKEQGIGLATSSMRAEPGKRLSRELSDPNSVGS